MSNLEKARRWTVDYADGSFVRLKRQSAGHEVFTSFELRKPILPSKKKARVLVEVGSNDYIHRKPGEEYGIRELARKAIQIARASARKS